MFETTSNVVTDGLTLYYDMGNTAKSFIGAPTTNYGWWQNPRIDTSYAPYSATGSGTWNTKHPNAIYVYNDVGTDITGYVNTGVGDWTNTYHAIWTLDPILNRPVVTMRDFDGQWKAKNFGLAGGLTWTGMGIGVGTQYTISWLQWTDLISKYADSGIYGANGAASYNFWDGLSSANTPSTAQNTKLYTWERVYTTYTATSNWNLAAVPSGVYMYGHDINNGSGTVKIADVQVEVHGYMSGFCKSLTRSTTQSLLDCTSLNTYTMGGVVYASNNTFSFNGTANAITTSMTGSSTLPAYTRIVWAKPTNTSSDMKSVMGNLIGNNMDMAIGFANGYPAFHQYTKSNAGADADYTFASSTATPINYVYMIAVTVDRVSNTVNVYLNGKLDGTVSKTLGTSASDTVLFGGPTTDSYGGARMFSGTCYAAMQYNRALTAAEITQNYQALRGRFGI